MTFIVLTDPGEVEYDDDGYVTPIAERLMEVRRQCCSFTILSSHDEASSRLIFTGSHGDNCAVLRTAEATEAVTGTSQKGYGGTSHKAKISIQLLPGEHCGSITFSLSYHVML